MRKVSAKRMPECLNADQKRQRCKSSEQILDFFVRRDLNNFLSRLVTMDETWLYHYNPETKQHSMEWRHRGTYSLQKIPSSKILWKGFRLNFVGSRLHPSHSVSSKGPNYQRGVLLASAGAIDGHFEGKMSREGHQGCLVLARQCPGSPSICTPEETNLSGLSGRLFRIWPRRTIIYSLGWKNNWKVAIFLPMRRLAKVREKG